MKVNGFPLATLTLVHAVVIPTRQNENRISAIGILSGSGWFLLDSPGTQAGSGGLEVTGGGQYDTELTLVVTDVEINVVVLHDVRVEN